MVDGWSSGGESILLEKNMAPTNFENLRIYVLSEQLADCIWQIVQCWDPFARETVGKQIVKSADSVGANIAEGVGRWGQQDQKRFIYIARGSLNETTHWLRRAYRRKLLSSGDVEQLKSIVSELAPKLNAYANSLGRIQRRQRSTINDQRSKN
jgi:four helix bundle protein